MKVSCLQENLARGLSIVGRAVSPRSTLPVLSNVLLATDGGRMKLSATNLEVGINCWIGGKVEEEGAITVPARTLIDLVNSLRPGQVEMEAIVRTQTLNIRAIRSEANIKGIDAQDFPVVPVPEGGDGVRVDPAALRQAIDQVAFVAATDESRPILTGVLAKFEDDRLTMAAADGYRLSVRTIQLAEKVPDPFSVIVPGRAMVELARVSGEQADPVTITVTPTHNQILFQLTDVVLVSQLIDGNFPDYRQIIPTERNTETVVDTDAFLDACKTALIFARDAAHITRLHVKPPADGDSGRIIVSATSAETGDDVTDLDATVDGDEVEIAFNVRYLIDVLSVVGSPQVTLETTESSSPGVLRPASDADFTHVIMPMHLGH
jgi:DNA polymerase-3 subunit beta